jgi:hypothetical protein
MLTMSECSAPDLPTFRNRATSGTVYAACQEHRDWVVEQVERIRPALVVTSSLADFANRIVGVDDSDPAKYDAWRDGTEKTLRDLAPFSERLVVLGSPPNTGNLQTCVTARSTPEDCVREVTTHRERVLAAEQAAAQTAGATFVNPIDWFCYDDRCPAVVDGMPVMRDGTHATAEYMRRIAPLLRPLLLDTPGPSQTP